MTQHLVVPIDGSTTASTGAAVAVALARKTAATVHLVEVAFSCRDIGPAQARLAECAQSLNAVDVEIQTDVRLSGDLVVNGIDEVLEEYPGALVVMSSHGRGRSSALIGSVADDILQSTFGPLLLVGPNAQVGDFSGPVVAPVDGSTPSEAALPLAAAWAIELGVSPWIVNVMSPSSVLPPSADVADSVYPARLAHDLTQACQHRVEFEELHGKHPAVTVAGFAADLDASLIVTASHRRSGWSRLAMGSVASGFVRHAACPILMIRPPTPPATTRR
ncbi:MAG: nucleotide-binding universal stress UspA family protein [Ilumatobacter sp.]|jgi:nucleotide-binding universal stress UspA family protein